MSEQRGHEVGIEVHNVWKKFRRGEVHDSLRDLIPAVGKRLMGRGPRSSELAQGDFWALQDVSFQVRPGEVLGIIGANGAGKSTMLKILTRILRPNRGTYAVRGRVGALIEVAAGFHPDLTGRENVFLQGAIMGMKASEIRTRFDDIVEFAGLADAIDTPVKRYSSGMNARLGFAIAAHLDPDVLIIDEVLAVGDFAFQEKAFDRMRTLARSGMPVVVVSHQLDRVVELCTQAILLERGRVVREGRPAECVAAYTRGQLADPGVMVDGCPVKILSIDTETSSPIRSGEWLHLHVRGAVSAPIPEHLEAVGLRVRALHTGETLFATSTAHAGIAVPGVGSFGFDVALQMNVPPGIYLLETSTWDRRENRDAATGPALQVEVAPGTSFYGSVQMNPRFRPAAARAGGETGPLSHLRAYP